MASHTLPDVWFLSQGLFYFIRFAGVTPHGTQAFVVPVNDSTCRMSWSTPPLTPLTRSKASFNMPTVRVTDRSHEGISFSCCRI